MTSTDPGAPAAHATPPEPAAGEGRRGGRGHITSYGAGRRCSVAGCQTILSVYNDTATCAGHLPLSGSGPAATNLL